MLDEPIERGHVDTWLLLSKADTNIPRRSLSASLTERNISAIPSTQVRNNILDRRQIIVIDLASSLCIYLSLYLETDNRRKYLLSFWESALADEIRADLITGNVNAR